MTKRYGLAFLACMIFLTQPAYARSLLGSWVLTQAEVAPWSDGSIANAGLKDQTITFSATSVGGPSVLNCERARYAEVSVPRAGLFMGGLPAPAERAAQKLGFTRSEVASVALSCSTGVFMFHFTPQGTLKFALDDTIWTLRRR